MHDPCSPWCSYSALSWHLTRYVHVCVPGSRVGLVSRRKHSRTHRVRSLWNEPPVFVFGGLTSAFLSFGEGFSAKIVEILNDNGASYGSFDILADDEVLMFHLLLRPLSNGSLYGISPPYTPPPHTQTHKHTAHSVCSSQVRQGLKTFSNWPTYPQLYVNGELLGGLDIVQEMAANGDLAAALPKPAVPAVAPASLDYR